MPRLPLSLLTGENVIGATRRACDRLPNVARAALSSERASERVDLSVQQIKNSLVAMEP